MTADDFTYLDPGPLIDGDLRLALSHTYLHRFDQQFAQCALLVRMDRLADAARRGTHQRGKVMPEPDYPK